MNPDADTVVLVPILRRAHRVAPLVASIRATSDPHILFLVTPGDTAVIDAIREIDGDLLYVDWQPFGDYARKINAGYAGTDHRYLVTAADDIHFHPGWLTEAKAVAQARPGAGVIGTQDLGNSRVIAGQHSTHFLITREYVDRCGTIDHPGQVMHEGYVHEFVDDEVVGTARHRRAWAFAARSVLEHLHYNWGKAPLDEFYAGQVARMDASRPLFERRRRLWM